MTIRNIGILRSYDYISGVDVFNDNILNSFVSIDEDFRASFKFFNVKRILDATLVVGHVVSPWWCNDFTVISV